MESTGVQAYKVVKETMEEKRTAYMVVEAIMEEKIMKQQQPALRSKTIVHKEIVTKRNEFFQWETYAKINEFWILLLLAMLQDLGFIIRK